MGRYNMRFRRSIGFGKLFRLNFGKRGMSVSAGVPGARRTWHTSGRRTTTFGLPGTGVSWQKIDTPTQPAKPPRQRPEQPAPGPATAQPTERAAPEPSDLELILRAKDELDAKQDRTDR